MIWSEVINTKWPVSAHCLENALSYKSTHKGLENSVKELGARRAVVQMERADLEDKHLNLMEENLVVNIPSEEFFIFLLIISY